MTLQTRFSLVAVSGVAIAGALVGLASLAAAAQAPVVAATIENSSNSTIASALVGSSVHARTEVSSSTSSTSPAGTVDFSLYSGNQSCSGTPLTQTGVALASGVAVSNTATLPIGGLSYKVHYNGQTDLYTEADSTCVAVAATQAAPALSLSLSNTSVLAGSDVYAIPSLTGETAGADGSIAYRAYSDNACSTLALSAGTKTVTDGTVSNSDAYEFNTAGTYYWQGVYSGDADNAPATSTCAAAGSVLSVEATSTPAPTPGTISGTVYNDLNKNDTQDSGEAGLASWTVWLHKASATTTTSWWKKILKGHDFYDDPIVATATTDANGVYSFGSLAEGTYFVEESVQAGWKQTSDDVKVSLTAADPSADVDFANIQKSATSTNPGHRGDDNDNDHGHDKGDKGDNGNHNGWFKLNTNIGGWFHFGRR